jgi:WXG100 family type VII secretion target
MTDYRMAYAEVAGVINEFQATSNNIQGILENVNASRNKFLNVDMWTGPAQQTYTECQQKWNNAVQEMQQMLPAAQRALDAIATNYQLTDLKVANTFS